MPKLPSAKFIYASPQRGVALIMAVLVAAMITGDRGDNGNDTSFQPAERF